MQGKNKTFRLAALAVAALVLISTTGHAATFTVNSLFDDTFSNDSNPGDGTCLDSSPNSNTCTLRAAIEEANALAGPDRIEFSVAGEIGPDSGLLGPLPDITDELVIFAGNAPGATFGGPPMVYLDGAAVDPSSDPFAAGLRVVSGSLEVFDLGIVAFPRAGIEFDNGIDGGRVDRCWLGLDADGNVDAHPSSLSTVGVRLLGSNAVIGKSGPPGALTGLGNIISGNAAGGIQILGDANTVLGNTIGMTLEGLVARGNGNYGIFMFDTADSNRIGGGDPGDDSGNHIANNSLGGIVVDGSGNEVDANTFGFKPGTGVFFASGTTAIEVAGDGHVIGGAEGNRIVDRRSGTKANILLGRTPVGGDTPATNVLVTGNRIGTETVSLGSRYGIRVAVDGSTGNAIADNLINNTTFGVQIDADGNTVTRNQLGTEPQLGSGNQWGIQVSSANNEITENTIGNSEFEGILITGAFNLIFANDIGFAASIGAVGNGRGGIEIRSGTDTLIQGNRILNNGGPGIAIRDIGSIEGITVLGNSIRSNEGIGVDILEFDGSFMPGPTLNDPGDADTGANRKMNYPEFGEAVPVPGSDPLETVVTYLVDADTANQAYPITVDFYYGQRVNGYGRRDGSALIGSDTYDTPGASKTLTLTLPGGIGADWHFSALATDADGNTSEFAPARSLGEMLFRDGYEE